MPLWKPVQTWLGQDVFIIGGGDSLRKFDFNILKDECVIGCNTAFTLGHEICDVCIFGDATWFAKWRHELVNYKGTLFTNANQLAKSNIPWLWHLSREMKGLHHNSLGWNKNTGASAINLALILGAKRIYLLGFDMKISKDNRPNWHNRSERAKPEVYPKFLEMYPKVKADLDKKFPDREVINVNDDSMLDCFPTIGVKKFFMERKKNEALVA